MEKAGMIKMYNKCRQGTLLASRLCYKRYMEKITPKLNDGFCCINKNYLSDVIKF